MEWESEEKKVTVKKDDTEEDVDASELQEPVE